MVLPPTYADCSEFVEAEHATTLLDVSRHIAVPSAVCSPEILIYEPDPRTKFTSALLAGVKVDRPFAEKAPSAVRDLPVATVVSPLSCTVPVPVEKVPTPLIAKLPDVCEYPVMCSNEPPLVSLLVPPVKSEPSARSRFATCPEVEFIKESVRVAFPVMSNVVSPPV